MIILQPTKPTPKAIYHIISGSIRYNEHKPLPIIEESLQLLCQYYEQNYNIDRDYLYNIIAIPALSLILGDRYWIYKALSEPKYPASYKITA